MTSVHLCFVYLSLQLLVCSYGHLDDLPVKINPREGFKTQTVGSQSIATSGTEDSTVQILDIKMPGIRPTSEDAYICTSVPMVGPTQYITNFEALASATTAHHLLVFGCKHPAATNSWVCGAVCGGGESPKILYAWARNAPPTKMPPDVGFMVGPESELTSLILQIHYKSPILPSEPEDYSGIRLTLTTARQKYIAGIFLLMRYDIQIPPHTKGYEGNISCEYKGKAPLYPFGYRVHAHELSSVISAYQHNGNWSLLGKGNPKWPEAFYPMKEKHEIKPGDKLFAKCTYDSTFRDTVTRIGGTHTDEMCNFYMMYYMDSANSESYLQCTDDAFPAMSLQMPVGSSIPPPPNPELEDLGEGRHAHESPAHRPPGVEVADGWPLISPEDKLTLGQIGGVGTDTHGNVFVFHRGSRKWERNSFDKNNVFSGDKIKENTMVMFNAQGKVMKQWGNDYFYMPHGLHIDDKDNIWLTDVGRHQVFRFKSGSTTPDLVLGEERVPGNDQTHFCKPTDVAVLKSGEFFVSDGYCNNRIIKYSKDGKRIKEWGTATKGVDADGFPPPGAFDIPHSLALIEQRNWLCVADRENGRIQIFTLEGKFVKQIHPKEFTRRLFAVSYSPVTDLLYAVNGPDLYNKETPVLGFTIHPDTGTLLETWGPPGGFQNPHDLEVSFQADFIYVGELDPLKIWRFFIHKDILEDQKRKKGVLMHPMSVDGSKESVKIEAEENDLGASMVIGALLVIPVVFILVVTVFLRLRKNAQDQGYVKATLLEGDESDEENFLS